MIDDFKVKDKLRTVREVLKELEGIVEDGIANGNEMSVEVDAIDMIEAAVDVYKEMMKGA